MAVIRSCFVFLGLATICLAGTIPNRANFPIPTDQIQTQSGGKSSPRRVMNPAFANAGRTPGLEIWRIENFEPVVYPKNNYGKFYTGDSFIVMNTVEGKDKKLSWDIHFWLGSETSPDEAGAAAIYTVQLDDLLNGGPVQHREVQDHESQLFLSYFRNGVRYEQGGVSTGFRHVDTNAAGEKRLFQVKGKRNVRVRQVNLSVSSMNKGDCFILDAGNDIYVYVGAQAKRVEKLKAISAANQIRDQDHHGRARVSIVDEFSSDVDKQQFFDILGSGSPGQVPDESTDLEDAAFETADANAVSLYKIADSTGRLKVDPITTKPLRQEMLETNDCFILDTGSGIYVWVGRGSTQREKTEAMSKAQEFLRTKKYPAWTQIHRLIEGAETAPFKQYFATWRDVGMAHTRLVRSASGYESEESEVDDITDIDVTESNLKENSGRDIGFLPDNGENTVQFVMQYYSIPGRNEVRRNPLQFDTKMPLMGFSAYTFSYKYNTKNGESGTIIYVWEGVKASHEARERAFEDALAMAVEQNAILVRTVQNHELRHFIKIFKGDLLTVTNATPTSAEMLRIHGTDATDVHATEVKADSGSLASSDVFALISFKYNKIFIWIGLGASDFEKNMALQRFAQYWVNVEIEVIEEGAEPDDFWDELNGEGIYDRSLIDVDKPILEPRLYHCRFEDGRINVEETAHFEQEDLNVDDVMLIDAGDEIYMWVGNGATAEENGRILNMAKKYIKHEPSTRTIDTVSVIRITQGNEPQVFTRMFPQWDINYWQPVPVDEEIVKPVLDDNEHVESNEV